MSKKYRLFLDQMFKIDVAQKLREEGYDVLRASEIGKDRADDEENFNSFITFPSCAFPGSI
jgi:hypothetical protein